MTEGAPRYDFDEEFQSKIAALMLRDPVFTERTVGLIEPGYFENVAEAALVNVVGSYHRRYRRLPDLVVLTRLLKEAFDRKVFREDLREPLKERIRKLYKDVDISDRDYVIDQVAEFAKHQAIEKAILESVELLEKRRFDEIDTRMKKAMNVGAMISTGGVDYFEALSARSEYRRDLLAGRIKPTGITTGIPDLDKELLHGGWGRKELSVLMGGAKVGKTMGLADFSKNAAFAGRNVLITSLEVSKEIVQDRLDASFSEVMLKKLKESIFEIEEKVKAAAAKGGRIIIEEFPTGTMRPMDLRRLIDHYKAKGLRFDLITVDYGDIMAPDIQFKDPIENSKNIFVGLRAIAQEENAAVLTATQTNREGYKAVVSKAEHVAEDFNKIRIADLILSINSTDEERAMGEGRLFFAGSRNQESHFTLRIKQDLSRAQFIKRVLGKE